MTTWHDFMCAIIVGLAAIAGLGCRPAAPPPEAITEASQAQRPNILLISLDACRADRLGCYGHERNTSPFIDELAASGLRFSNAFVNTHGTPPSHTTMFSSLYQQSHGVYLDGAPLAGVIEKIPSSVVMLQEILRGSGYTTIGVSGGGNMSSALGFGRGFVEYDDRLGKVSAQKHRLLKLIDRHHVPKRPLYMLFHTYEIHSPYEPPPKWAGFFGTFPSDVIPSSEVLLSMVHRASTALDDDDLQHLLALYDGEIRFTDTVLRELFARLEDQGLLENIVVVITSDHGEEFAEHGGLLHRGTLYEELIRVPLVLWGAGVPKGVVEDRLVSAVDIMPTILAAAGVPAPLPMAGRDLLAVDQDEDPAESFIFCQYGRHVYGIRGVRWKLIVKEKRGVEELYDLQMDPGETNNLITDEPLIALDLRQRIETWKAGLQEGATPTSAHLSAIETQQLEALGYIGGEIGGEQ